MKTIWEAEFRRSRRGLLIWSAVVGLVAFLGILEYPVVGQYSAYVEKALVLIPKLGQLVFGVYNVSLQEPAGYYIVMYYWTGLIVFVHAVVTGASIVAKETRDHTAEYLFTMPCSRGAVIWAKTLAGVAGLGVVAVVTIGMSVLGMLPVSRDPALHGRILLSGVGLFLAQCVLFSLGLLCSALAKSYRTGMLSAVAALLLCYCGLFFVQYVERPDLFFLSPLAYFDVSGVMESGLRPAAVALALGVSALCFFCTQRLYAHKEMGAQL